MGNSFDIYVNPLTVSKEVYKEIKDLLEGLLQYGSFNSYEDYYEVKSDRQALKFKAPCGRDIEVSMKYVTVHHKLRYQSLRGLRRVQESTSLRESPGRGFFYALKKKI